MTPDMMFCIALFIGLVVFYQCNEPKARERDRKRRELREELYQQQHSASHKR